jgi:hypothetical protein
LTFFVISPAVGILVAYRNWQGRRDAPDPKRYGARCVAFGVIGLSLFALISALLFVIQAAFVRRFARAPGKTAVASE